MAGAQNLFRRMFLRSPVSAPGAAIPETSPPALVPPEAVPKLKGRFCANPWSYVEIFSGGEVFVCCSLWTGFKHIGNVYTDTPEQIWNGHQAVALREGILDGSFRECDHDKCPLIFGNSLPTYDSVRREWYGDVMGEAIDNKLTISPRGPLVVKLMTDASCNLTCPSCRDHLILANRNEQRKMLNAFEKSILPLLEGAKILVLAGDGDPFGSHYYRDILIRTADILPNLKIGLHANAVLLDEKAWSHCRLDNRTEMIQVSIDAATEETYSVVRRRGDFRRLLRNLEFVAAKKRPFPVTRFELVFVVQTQNFREMKEFVLLGKGLGVNSIEFMLIDHWQRGMSDAEYQRQKIWGYDHPLHSEFLEALRDPIFDKSLVKMSFRENMLRNIRPKEVSIPSG